jgi:hypothetical protein
MEAAMQLGAIPTAMADAEVGVRDRVGEGDKMLARAGVREVRERRTADLTPRCNPPGFGHQH